MYKEIIVRPFLERHHSSDSNRNFSYFPLWLFSFRLLNDGNGHRITKINITEIGNHTRRTLVSFNDDNPGLDVRREHILRLIPHIKPCD